MRRGMPHFLRRAAPGAAAVLGVLCVFTPPAAAQYTNIVVIVADDMGWADIGYNNPAVYTPNLDALAAGGVRFTQHYVMSQCTPTRAALFTGRFPSRSGTQAQQASNDQSYPHGTPTLSSLLAAMGYECYMAGKWHMGSAPEWGPNHHGFDESYGSLTGAVGMYDHRYRPGNAYEITWHRNHDIIPGYENGVHATDLVADDAIRFISRTHDGPFFAYLPFHAPHTPLDERGAFTNTPTQLDTNDNTRWLNEDQVSWFNDPAGKIQAEPDPEKRLLLAAVHHLDSAIGRIVAALDQTGLRDSTAIFFSSDNGPQVNWGGNAYPDDLKLTDFNQPDALRGFKTDVYEGGTLVPGFIKLAEPIRAESRDQSRPHRRLGSHDRRYSRIHTRGGNGVGRPGHHAAREGHRDTGRQAILLALGQRQFQMGHTLRRLEDRPLRLGARVGLGTGNSSAWLQTGGKPPTLASVATSKLTELHALFVAERDKDLGGQDRQSQADRAARRCGPLWRTGLVHRIRVRAGARRFHHCQRSGFGVLRLRCKLRIHADPHFRVEQCRLGDTPCGRRSGSGRADERPVERVEGS